MRNFIVLSLTIVVAAAELSLFQQDSDLLGLLEMDLAGSADDSKGLEGLEAFALSLDRHRRDAEDNEAESDPGMLDGPPPGEEPPPSEDGEGPSTPPPGGKGPRGECKMRKCCKSMPKLRNEKVKQALKECKQEEKAKRKEAKNKGGEESQKQKDGKDDGKKKRHGKGGPGRKCDCVTECVFKKVGAMSDDGKVDMEKTRAAIMEIIKETDESMVSKWESPVASATQKCSDSIKEKREGQECQSLMPVAWCIKKQMFLNCPEGDFDNSEECQDVKKMVENGPGRKKGKKNEEA